MPLILQNRDLLDLMKNFYIVTGMRIVLFDEKYAEIISYPKEGTPFCSRLRLGEDFNALCIKSDAVAFETCKKSRALYMYKCHAGLIEATAPITDGGTIIGYIMFGQITDNKDKERFAKELTEYCRQFTHSLDLTEQVKKIKYRSQKQLVAASKILEACTSYILLKEMVLSAKNKQFNTIDDYIDKHIEEKLDVQTLCRALKVSRTKLYELTDAYVEGGIANYIKTKRLLKAKSLVKETDLPISAISDKVGFSDYNYFLRVFKKQFGISPKNLRKKQIV